jgi:hypothetical protein
LALVGSATTSQPDGALQRPHDKTAEPSAVMLGAVSICSATAVAPVRALWPRAARGPSGAAAGARPTPPRDHVRGR